MYILYKSKKLQFLIIKLGLIKNFQYFPFFFFFLGEIEKDK